MVATPVEHEHRVTPRELFFDLVFVFAFTQVATLLADDPTFAGIGRGVLVLAALWWAWTRLRLADEHRRPRGGLCRRRAARRADRDVRGGACGAGRVRRRGRALRRRLPCRLRNARSALRPRRPRKPRPARRRAPAGAVDAARRDPDPRRRLHGRRAHVALARRARVHLRRRRPERVDGLATAPVALRGALRPRGDHRARRGVHLDRDRCDRDRHRAGRGRGRDPRAPRCHLVLARLLRLLLDPRRADAPRSRRAPNAWRSPATCTRMRISR